MKGTPTLFISSELEQQIEFLHNKHKGLEWSGPLIYDIIEGDLDDPDNMVIVAKAVFPMDIGTGSYTDFEHTPESTINLYEAYPELETGSRIGLIHSHHNMTCYFSPTDKEELAENTQDYNPYLSLIVSNKNPYKAMVGFTAEVEESINRNYSYVLSDGTPKKSTFSKDDKKTVANLYDCKIVREESEFDDQVFLKQYEWLMEKRKASRVASNITHLNGNHKKTIGFQPDYPDQGYTQFMEEMYGIAPNTSTVDLSDHEHIPDFIVDERGAPLNSHQILRKTETFLMKLISSNPTNRVYGSIIPMLRSHQNYKYTMDEVLEIIDDCLDETFGGSYTATSTARQRLWMIEEAILYLEADDLKNKPLIDVHPAAKALHIILSAIVTAQAEIVDEIIDEEIVEGAD